MICRQDLELSHRHLMILEAKLAKNGCTIELEQKCQNLHQSFIPALDTIVVLANKPGLSIGHSSAQSYLQ